MTAKDAALVFAVLLMTACMPSGTTATPASTSDKEPAGMETTPATPAATTVDASALLEGLLRLIEGSKDIADFTPERLEAELGMPIKVVDEENWGGSQQITPEWWMKALVYPQPTSGQRTFAFDFNPDVPESRPPMTAICSMDMQRFGQQLINQGMKHETMYGEHGRRVSERYTREGLGVEVTGRHEADEPETLRSHECVFMVLIY